MAQSNPATDTATDTTPPARVDDPTQTQKRRLASCAVEHLNTVAGEYRDDLEPRDIRWHVSTNAQRTSRAGDCRQRADGDIEVTLTWAAYAAWGWAQFSGTVRHEYAHAWLFRTHGKHGHGWRFKMVARELAAPLKCEPFAEKRLKVRCPKGCETQRDRASSLVKDPEGRVCTKHREPLTVTHRATGRSWTTATGYKRVRNAIERNPGEEW